MPRMVPGTSVALTSDGGYLIDARNELCFHLNEVGTLIWKRLQDGADLRLIVAELRRQFPESDPDVLLADARSFVDDLARAGLIVSDSAAGGRA